MEAKPDDGFEGAPRRDDGASEKTAVGIDLGIIYPGTSMQENIRVIMENQGNLTTPGYVAFTDGEQLTENDEKEPDDEELRKITSHVAFASSKQLIGDTEMKSDDEKIPKKIDMLNTTSHNEYVKTI